MLFECLLHSNWSRTFKEIDDIQIFMSVRLAVYQSQVVFMYLQILPFQDSLALSHWYTVMLKGH